MVCIAILLYLLATTLIGEHVTATSFAFFSNPINCFRRLSVACAQSATGIFITTVEPDGKEMKE
jgi:hypothetical protein